ncbi:MAG: CPBP family intramembrane metalloprotease [Ruminococcus sp.]|nr:CPBP family intramembrane metalloprotease [Ruminococcus sp.]
MIPYYNNTDLITYNYKKQLKKDSNTLGWILSFYVVTMFIVSLIGTFAPIILNTINNPDTALENSMDIIEDTTFVMIMSGAASLITFFGISIIYTTFSKKSLGKLFPLDKVGANTMYLLCTFGLAVAMTANYASNILISLFDAVGIDAYVDIEYKCDNALDVILFYVTVAVIPALVEEFAFRGVILGVLRKYSDSLAILVSGITFGVMHGNFTQIPFAFIVGLVLGYIAVKTNSLLPGIIIHFLNNATSVTLTLLDTNTSLDDHYIYLANFIIMLIIVFLGLTSFIALAKKHNGFFKLPKTKNILTFKEEVKTVFLAPTVIIFTAISFLEAILMLS